MNWVKSLRAWALLMSGQRSQDMEIRGLDADSDQALVEQIQVPCALINSQGQADPRKKLERSWKEIVVLDPCQSFSDRSLPGRAGRPNDLTAAKFPEGFPHKGPHPPQSQLGQNPR